MGVHGLIPFLQKHCPQCFESCSDLRVFAGQRVAVDVSNYMYKFLYRRQPGSTDEQFLQVFVAQWEMLKRNGITAIYVFDGQHPEEKRRENEKRTEQRQANRQEKHRRLGLIAQKRQRLFTSPEGDSTSEEEAFLDLDYLDTEPPKNPPKVIGALDQLQQTLYKMSSLDNEEIVAHRLDLSVPANLYTTLARVFFTHGIPFVHAKSEAEQCCAWMARCGLVQLVASEDTDAIAHGTEQTLRLLHQSPTSWSIDQSSIVKTRHIVRLSTILKTLKITMETFVHLCVMAGTDFSSRLPRIGIETSLRLMQEYKTIDVYLKSIRGRHFLRDAQVMEKFRYQGALRIFSDKSQQLEPMFLLSIIFNKLLL
jgi:5'-3' exonuclease